MQINTRELSEVMNREHRFVTRSVRNLFPEIAETTFTDKKGREYPAFNVNRQQAIIIATSANKMEVKDRMDLLNKVEQFFACKN